MNYVTQIPEEFGFLRSGNHRLEFHSKYRNTVNYIYEGGIIALQSEGTQVTPLSLSTNIKEPGLNLIPEHDAVISDGIFKAGPIVIVIKDAETYSSSPRAMLQLNSDVLHRLEDMIIACEESHAKNKCTNVIIKFAEETIENTCKIALSLFKSNDFCASAANLSGLIGLGQGLTPSGDDILVGIMALMSHTDNSCASEFILKLKQRVTAGISGTGDVSAAYLMCAVNNRFSGYVLEMMKAMAGEDPEKQIRSVEKVAMTGHSSGIDLLKGVRWACMALETECGG